MGKAMKNALVYIDNNQVKVVFGSILKIIKINEIRLSHNAAFFEQLFKEANVYGIREVSQLGLEQIFDMSPLESHSEEEKKVDKSIDKPVSQEARPVEAKDKDEFDFWIKSQAETAIIIDDLFTGREIAEGIPESLSIPHARAVNLASLNPEAVKASRILRRLMDNKTIVRCSRQEALQMEREYQERLANSKNAKSVVGEGGLSVEVVGGKAEKFMYSESQIHNNVIETEISVSDTRSPSSGLLNEEYSSMDKLMSVINSEPEQMSGPPVVAPRRQLAQRKPVEKTGLQAVKFKRAGD